MVALEIEYKCLACGMELDPEEYETPEDADFCGYCFTDQVNSVMRRSTWPQNLNDCGKHREACHIAWVELTLAHLRRQEPGSEMQRQVQSAKERTLCTFLRLLEA